MFIYSVTPDPIDLNGAYSAVTISVEVREMDTAGDRWYYEAYSYDQGQRQTLYSGNVVLIGQSSYTFHLTPTKSALASIISDKYEGTVYVEISSYSGAWDVKSIPLKDSSYAVPTVRAAISYSNALTVGQDVYGIQQKTKAVADFSSTSQGRFAITDYGMTVNMTEVTCTVSGTTATSPVFGTYGIKIITPRVYSGGKWFDGTAESVEILPYYNPSLVRLTTETEIVVRRAASDGTYLANGQYLYVGCRKRYAPLNADGADRNRALVEACISENGGAYGAWFTVSGENDSDDIQYTSSVTVLSNASSTYEVKLRITDAASEIISVFNIGTANFPLHLAAGGRAVGLGQVASSSNDRIDCGWPVFFNGGVGDKTVYSGAEKTSGEYITASEGDLDGLMGYHLFIVNDNTFAFAKGKSSSGYTTRTIGSSSTVFSFDNQNNRIRAGTSITSIQAII